MTTASSGPVAAQDEDALPTYLTVQNNRPVPVVVYLEQEHFETRLGTVPPRCTGKVDLPRYQIEGEAMKVLVHPEGSMDLASGEFTLEPGHKLEVLVPTNDLGYMPPPAPEMLVNPSVGETTVTLENPRDQPVTLFVERGVFDVRIDVVPPHQELRLTIPSSLIGNDKEVELFLHPEGGQDLTGHVFEVKPGSHLHLMVPIHGPLPRHP